MRDLTPKGVTLKKLIHVRHQARSADDLYQLVTFIAVPYAEQIIPAGFICEPADLFTQYFPLIKISFFHLQTILVNDAAAIDLFFIHDPQKRPLFLR